MGAIGIDNARFGLHRSIRAMSHWGAELTSVELWQASACVDVTAEMEPKYLFYLQLFLCYMCLLFI